jgi:hypothetical protein
MILYNIFKRNLRTKEIIWEESPNRTTKSYKVCYIHPRRFVREIEIEKGGAQCAAHYEFDVATECSEMIRDRLIP